MHCDIPYYISLLWCAGFTAEETAAMIGFDLHAVRMEFIMLDYVISISLG